MSGMLVTNVTAFVDWNTQIYAAHPPIAASPSEVAERTLYYVGRAIGRLLNDIQSDAFYNVSLRLYHGWHKGFEITARRKAIIQVAAGTDFVGLSQRRNVIFRDRIDFGDRLLSASSKRLHLRLGCHLPNTLRNIASKPGEMEEKMVDTALASDLVDTAHREPKDWLLVMARDDDMVPPSFAAEAIIGNRGGRVVLAREKATSACLNLQGIGFAV